jgi:hypothetical protein
MALEPRVSFSGFDFRAVGPMNQGSHHSRAVFDNRPDRNTTWAGWSLACAILWRSLLVACIAGAVAALLGPPAPIQRRLGAAAVGAGVFAPFAVAYIVLAMINDYRNKRSLGKKYGLVIRYGSDAVQHRRVDIAAPPADLAHRILSALRGVAADGTVHQLDDLRFEAKRPAQKRPGSLFPERLASLITVQVKPTENGSVAILASSRIDQPVFPGARRFSRLGFDSGRSIENVEEFQLALQRLLTDRRG